MGSLARILAIRTALCLLWLSVVGAGFTFVLNYQNLVGRVGVAPQHWPARTQIVPNPSGDTLIMFVHPQCPCTRASIEELNLLLARCPSRTSAQVWFFKPATAPRD